MAQYEYRVITAPTRGVKAKGIKTPEDRFSHALEVVMNEMAAEGWEYQRAETLPSTERSGLASTVTNWRNMLIFRRDPTGSTAMSDGNVLSEQQTRSEPTIRRPVAIEDDADQGDISPDTPHDNDDETIPATATSAPTNKQIKIDESIYKSKS